MYVLLQADPALTSSLCDPITHSKGGLGHMWAHSVSGVNTDLSWATFIGPPTQLMFILTCQDLTAEHSVPSDITIYTKFMKDDNILLMANMFNLTVTSIDDFVTRGEIPQTLFIRFCELF